MTKKWLKKKNSKQYIENKFIFFLLLAKSAVFVFDFVMSGFVNSGHNGTL